MAILLGFPPSNTIGAGVYITELDLSFVPTDQAPNVAGLVGFATKGPINVPTLITSTRQLHKVFGYPIPSLAAPYLIYAAEQYLAASTQLWVVRCGATDPVDSDAAVTASIDIPSAGGQVTIVSNALSPYAPSADTFFRWRLNGIEAQKLLVVFAPANRPSPYTGIAYTATTLASTLNSQLVDADGIQFYVASNGNIAVKTTFSFGPTASVELMSVSSAMYGPTVTVNSGTGARTLTNSIFGLGLSMLPAQVVGTLSKYPNNSYQTAGTYNLTSVVSPNLQIVVDGTASTSIDNVVQTVVVSATSYTAATLAAAINTYVAANLPGGFKAYVVGNNLAITTTHSGRDARLLIKPDSTLNDLLGLATTTALGSGNQGVATDADTYNDAIVTGSTNTSGAVVFTITAESPGTSGNLTQVVITDNVREGTFNFQVYSNGANVESWGSLTKDTTSRLYSDGFLTLNSSFIRTVDNTAVAGLPLAGTYTLSGGTDGVPSDADSQDALIIGSDIARTGMQAFSDPEQIDIDLIAVPGHSSTSVVTSLLNMLALQRQDCFGLVDPPFAFTVNEIVAWQNGQHTLNSTRFDSSYAALYWPWVKIRDTYNRIDVWVPPSGSVLATYVLSDNLAAPWFAPAGLNRGLVPLIEDVYSTPTSEERNLMYGYRNAVNPIIKFPGTEGFFIFGEKTLQRRPTALDRVNVRRLMLYLEKTIREAAKRLLFEPHDAQLRRQFVNISSRVLDTVKTQRGVYDFIVKCDEELNTPDVIDRNELRAQIGVQPVRTAEFIFIEFSIHRTGTFNENADTF
jgi:phage tail sheath protein FI